ncbi:MAG: hypothetical protein LBB36_04800, partial [Fibromonadaceae bacterium]|nr:hypothetical protein [Fibromonadaceae bacterium]
SEKAVKTILHNANNMPISITKADFFSLPPAQNALLVLNPPYGKRLGKEKNLYREIAKKIEKDFSKCAYAIICPFAETEKVMNRHVNEIQTYNGGLKVMVQMRQ